METSILFRVFGPMMFRGPMEFSPFVRGPQTMAESMPLPSPSTTSGAVASLALDLGLSKAPVHTDWIQQFKGALDFDDRSCLRGPCLYSEDGKCYLAYGGSLIVFDAIVDTLSVNYTEPGDLRQDLSSSAKDSEPNKLEHVGIALEDYEKRTREGYLYSTVMVDYSNIADGRNVYIAIDALRVPLLDKLRGKTHVVRLGGEGKLTELVVSDEFVLTRKVSELSKRQKKPMSAHLYLATHALFKTRSQPSTMEKVGQGVYVSPGFKSRIEEVLRKTVPKVKVEYITGKVTPFGGGYSLAVGARKPMYAALQPGAVMKLSQVDGKGLSSLYETGVSEVGSELGYGTAVPIPIVASN